MLPRRVVLPVTLLVLAAALAGCGQGSGSGAGTATSPAPSPTVGEASPPAPSPTPTVAAQDIRDVDLTAQPAVRDFLGTMGGVADPGRIIYADLTGDGQDEAVLPIGSGGEGGDLAGFVFGLVDGEVRELARLVPEEASNIVVSVEDGQLVTLEPVYGPGDALCCPSEFRRVSYRWDGTALVVDVAETVPAEDVTG